MRYEIRHPLDSGRNILVYLAKDRRNPSARRVFTRVLFLNGDRLSRAELEDLFNLRRSLFHPSLVEVCDLAFRGKQVGLISEFIEGTSLARSNGKRLSVDEAFSLAMQLVRVMTFLHSRRFLCGSVQPSQLFICADGRLVVNLLIPAVAHPREDGDWIQYVAPEILKGGAATVRGDLFSLGMVFYRLLTGHSPYLERDPDALRKKQLLALPSRPRRINPDIPSSVEGLILKMIQKDPRLRPPSLDYVQSALGPSTGSTPRAVPSFRSVQVGRRRELAAFRDHYETYLDRPSIRFAIIRGISGIGKTTLMESFRTIVQLKGARTYSLRHYQGGSDLQVLSRLRCQLVDEGMAQAGVFPGQDSTQASPIEFGVRLARMLAAVSKRGPVALCADDLQWMDEGSLSFYRTLAGMGEIPLVVIGTLRSDESPGHWGQLDSNLAKPDRLADLRLALLRQKDVRRLLTNLLGQPSTPELYARVWGQCGGNPFYILEYLRLLRQEGGLVYRSGRWDWMPEIGRSIVPSTVVVAIRSRLSKIDPQDLEILKYLSVMRMPAVLDWMATLLETSIEDLERQLVRLEGLDFVSIAGSLEQPVVNLIHDCLRGVIEGQLRPRELKNIHRSLATGFRHRYLESHHPLFRQQCVFHALVGGKPRWAREYLWDAVEWLEKASLYREAADLMESALRRRLVSKRTWKAVHKTVELFYLSGQLDKCADLCAEYLRHPPKDIRREAIVCVVMARVSAIRGQPEEQLSILRSTIRKLKNVPENELLPALEADLLGCLSRQGNFVEAEPIRRRLLKVVTTGLEGTSRDKIYHSLGHHAEHTGDVPAAVLWESMAIQEAWNMGKFVRGGRLVNLATFHLLIGNLSRGRQLAEYGLRTAEEIENRELAIFARCTRCLHARKEGRHQEALTELLEVLRINGGLKSDLHTGTEISIELAKNYNYLLLPQSAHPYLDSADGLLQREYVHPSFVDAKLARGWNWILMGRPGKVAGALSQLDPSKIPAEKTNYHLLLSHTRLLLGDYQGAWEEAKEAGDCLPKSMLYYRARVQLARVRALLAQGRLGEAEPYLREGLSLSKDGFFYPLMVQAWTLFSQVAGPGGESRRGAALFSSCTADVGPSGPPGAAR